MNRKDLEDQIIENYRKDERMMILAFAQWSINRGLDPQELYERAYPGQKHNPELLAALELTVPKEEAGDVADETVLNMLSVFGNDDLAFVVSEAIRSRK
ncbi:hypothetical protein FE782_05730 [Paenibacillus antri]|uniref:Uncharacterized protein n=1 Tax=Paenibacillus antri TaxID=2582848 RepID=A0A5R9GHL4_9BACL|nr:hypothetical protein [Paenibacillus antri]TLS52874.1 hypothetical protein FE782_05730 [Paenibacillus antri]